MPLHTRILIGLLLGGAAGVLVNLSVGLTPTLDWTLTQVVDPVGRVWLNGLIMVVIPLIVSTVSLGVAGLGSLRHVGRIGALTLASFFSLTAIGTMLGLLAVNIVRPGEGMSADVTARLMETYQGLSHS